MLLYALCISSTLVEKMIDLTNKYREENKLQPLQCLKTLNKAAQFQADYMCSANFLTHKNPLKKSLSDRLLNYDYVGEKIGENIAKQRGDDYQQVFNIWISNKPHDRNIKGNYEHFGIGTCKNGNDERYWVQVFGKKRQETEKMMDKGPIVVLKKGKEEQLLKKLLKNDPNISQHLDKEKINELAEQDPNLRNAMDKKDENEDDKSSAKIDDNKKNMHKAKNKQKYNGLRNDIEDEENDSKIDNYRNKQNKDKTAGNKSKNDDLMNDKNNETDKVEKKTNQIINLKDLLADDKSLKDEDNSAKDKKPSLVSYVRKKSDNYDKDFINDNKEAAESIKNTHSFKDLSSLLSMNSKKVKDREKFKNAETSDNEDSSKNNSNNYKSAKKNIRDMVNALKKHCKPATEEQNASIFEDDKDFNMHEHTKKKFTSSVQEKNTLEDPDKNGKFDINDDYNKNTIFKDKKNQYISIITLTADQNFNKPNQDTRNPDSSASSKSVFNSLLSSIYDKNNSVSDNVIKALGLLTSISKQMSTSEITRNKDTMHSSISDGANNQNLTPKKEHYDDKQLFEVLDLLNNLYSSEPNGEIAGVKIGSLIHSVINSILKNHEKGQIFTSASISGKPNEIYTRSISKLEKIIKNEMNKNNSGQIIDSKNNNANQAEKSAISFNPIADTKYMSTQSTKENGKNMFEMPESAFISDIGQNSNSEKLSTINTNSFNMSLQYFLSQIRENQSPKTEPQINFSLNDISTGYDFDRQSNMPEASMPNEIAKSIPVQSMLLYAMGSSNKKNNDLRPEEISKIRAEISRIANDSQNSRNPMENMIVSFQSKNNSISNTFENSVLSTSLENHMEKPSLSHKTIPEISFINSLQKIGSEESFTIKDTNNSGNIKDTVDSSNSILGLKNSVDYLKYILQSYSSKKFSSSSRSHKSKHIDSAMINTTKSLNTNILEELSNLFSHTTDFTKSKQNSKAYNDNSSAVSTTIVRLDQLLLNKNKYINDYDKNNPNIERQDVDNVQDNKKYPPQYNYDSNDYYPLARYPKSVNFSSIQPNRMPSIEQENPKKVFNDNTKENFYSGTIEDLKKLLGNQQYKDRSIQIIFSDGNQLKLNDVEVGESLECGS